MLEASQSFHPYSLEKPKSPCSMQLSSESLQADPERATQEALRVKPKRQWRLQEHRDARNVELCQGKLQAVSRASPREWPCGLQLARPQGLGCHIPRGASHAGHRAKNVICTARFQSCFGPILLSVLRTALLWNGTVYPVPVSPLCVGSMYLGFLFYRSSQLSICLESQRRHWTWTFEQHWNS